MPRRIDKHLGARVADARRSSGVSQALAAEAIEKSVQEYTLLENGEVRIRAVDLARMSRLFERPVSWFYQGLPGQAVFENAVSSKSV